MPNLADLFSRSAVRKFVGLVLVTGLAACQASPQPPAAVSAGVTAPSIARSQAVPGETTFAFEPFTGAPGNIADELSEQIGSEARRQGITLVRRVGASATYRVNGYLAATGEPGTVFYVFDIVDSSGKRLKRISGTESTGGTSGDPWQSVSSSELSRIANRSMVEIKAWLNRQ